MGKCPGEMEVYSRVTGYHQPTRKWNKGKQEEFKQRKPYKLPRINGIAQSVSAACVCLVLTVGCQMDMGKISEYQPDGKTVWKVSETRKNASTVQMILTIFGIRIKTLAPAGSDMAPVELDMGLIRAAENIVPMGERGFINTDAEGLMPWSGDKLHHVMGVNMDISTATDTKGNK